MVSVNRRPEWIEIAPHYLCNNRCIGCFSVSDSDSGLDSRAFLTAIAEGRRRGGRNLWLGGGEPTLRPDLVKAIKYARHVGYERVKVQSNGMRFAHDAFTAACANAGLTEVNLSLKGATAARHDELARTPGCFDAMVRGISELRAAGVRLEGDVLLYHDNVAELPELVAHFHALGVTRFNVWLLSTFGASDPGVAERVPRMTDVGRAVERTLALGLSDAPDFVTSFHTVPCTLPAGCERARFYPAELGLLIADAGGRWFWLEESPMEGGAYVEACARCALRGRCPGPRADYLAIHGADELAPVP